jgi:hypothetical protein
VLGLREIGSQLVSVSFAGSETRNLGSQFVVETISGFEDVAGI